MAIKVLNHGVALEWGIYSKWLANFFFLVQSDYVTLL